VRAGGERRPTARLSRRTVEIIEWSEITPAQEHTDALAAGGGEAKRAFEAMMPMKKI
jgi:hypothetical protein